MRFVLRVLASSIVLATARHAMGEIVCWPVYSGGNDHCYEAVLVPAGITWSAANAAAESRGAGWHLVTITSAAENAFAYALVTAPVWWRYGGSAGNYGGPWLGAYKVGPGVGDYAWVTGESFLYTNWGPWEPFDNGDRIGFFGYQTVMGPWWNDTPDGQPEFGYIVETNYPVAVGASTWGLVKILYR